MALKCPICNADNHQRPKKEWKFGQYFVKRYVCSSCGELFNVYSFSTGKERFTIPKRRQ
jgi:transposase-like protein